MNVWMVSAAVLGAALVPCVLVAVLADVSSGLVAMEIAGALGTTIMMVLAEAVHRQPFIDLAVVLALLATVGSLAFARVMERDT